MGGLKLCILLSKYVFYTLKATRFNSFKIIGVVQASATVLLKYLHKDAVFMSFSNLGAQIGMFYILQYSAACVGKINEIFLKLFIQISSVILTSWHILRFASYQRGESFKWQISISPINLLSVVECKAGSNLRGWSYLYKVNIYFN